MVGLRIDETSRSGGVSAHLKRAASCGLKSTLLTHGLKSVLHVGKMPTLLLASLVCSAAVAQVPPAVLPPAGAQPGAPPMVAPPYVPAPPQYPALPGGAMPGGAYGGYATPPSMLPANPSPQTTLPQGARGDLPPPGYAAPPGYGQPGYGQPGYAPPGAGPENGGRMPPLLGGPVVLEVRFEGLRGVHLSKLPKLRTRAAEPYDPQVVEDDVKALMRTRKFVDVSPKTQPVPGGIMVIFQVVERPIIQEIVITGCEGVLASTLLEKSGLKVGDGMDPYSIKEGRDKIEDYYHEHGWDRAHVTVREGANPGDRRAVFAIDEGRVRQVWMTNFIGNTFVSGARLRTLIKTGRPVLYIFGGNPDPKKIDEDVEILTSYYHGFGFLQAKVGREIEPNAKGDWITINYVINEGPRFKMRNIIVNGNQIFPTTMLTTDMKLKPAGFFDQGAMNKDVAGIRDQYGGRGFVFADIQPDLRYLDEPAQLDLIYNIKEGSRYRVGKINIDIKGDNPHTKYMAVLNRIQLRPGDILDTRKLRDSERRLSASGIFATDPSKKPKIVITPPPGLEDGVKGLAQKSDPKRPGWMGGSAGSGGGSTGSDSTGSGVPGSGAAGGGPGGSNFGGPSYRGQAPDGPEPVDQWCDVNVSEETPEAGGYRLEVNTGGQPPVDAARSGIRETSEARGDGNDRKSHDFRYEPINDPFNDAGTAQPGADGPDYSGSSSG